MPPEGYFTTANCKLSQRYRTIQRQRPKASAATLAGQTNRQATGCLLAQGTVPHPVPETEVGPAIPFRVAVALASMRLISPQAMPQYPGSARRGVR